MQLAATENSISKRCTLAARSKRESMVSTDRTFSDWGDWSNSFWCILLCEKYIFLRNGFSINHSSNHILDTRETFAFYPLSSSYHTSYSYCNASRHLSFPVKKKVLTCCFFFVLVVDLFCCFFKHRQITCFPNILFLFWKDWNCFCWKLKKLNFIWGWGKHLAWKISAK